MKEPLWKMREAVPLKIKLRFVAHDDCSKCEVSDAGIKCHLDLTLKVPFTLQINTYCYAEYPLLRNHLKKLRYYS